MKYIRFFNLMNKCSIQKEKTVKTMSRHTAENSIRSAISYAITVCSKHFIIGQSLPASVHEN